MITVTILINGNPILTRSAVNRIELNDQGETKYTTDAGDVLYHKRDKGAVELAKKMLDSIKEDSIR